MYRTTLLMLVVTWMLATGADAAVPASITVQGRLTDSLGNPFPSGPKGFTFKIYDAPSGGSEIWSGENQVITTDADGLWVALVGGIAGLNEAVFADTVRWLQVSVDNVHLPRVRLVTGPYAYRVATVDGAKGGTITSKVAIGSGHSNVGFETFVAGFDNNVDGDYTSVTGGQSNAANGQFSHIGGGQNDTANGNHSAIVGGLGNHTQGFWSFVGGGSGNRSTSEGAAVVGGGNNRARGTYAFVGGGGGNITDSNSASGAWSSVVGGAQNVAGGLASFIGGGFGNTAKSGTAVVVGGQNNRADTGSNFIGGGRDNHTDQADATVVGGWMNEALGASASILGGRGNIASGVGSTIAGGFHNRARGSFSFVGGGGDQPIDSNSAIGFASVIGGGLANLAQGDMGTVGGGERNEASQSYAVVAGGFNNEANGSQSFIGGGRGNETGDSGAVVAGGGRNVARGRFSFVGGGGSFDDADSNAALGLQSVVVGGRRNLASSQQTFVGGGEDNKATAAYTMVAGGNENSATALYAVVCGGLANSASGGASTVVGGASDTASGPFSLAAGYRAKAAHAGAFVWADSSNAQFASTAQDQFLIRATGGVGIGINAPDGPLHVQEGSAGTVAGNANAAAVLERSDECWLHILSPDGTQRGILFGSPANPLMGSIRFNPPGNEKGYDIRCGNNQERLILDSLGNLSADGCVTGSNIACPSDARLKRHIETLNGALADVGRLRGVRYEWKREEFPDRELPPGEQVGLIAQEVRDVVPQAVIEQHDGYLAVDYTRLVPLLIEGMKEQQRLIDQQRQDIEELRRALRP